MAFALVCVTLLPTARAVTPAPGGGYPPNNTAEGTDALHNNTTGTYNTANGFHALYSNTTGTYNTATGLGALFINSTGNNNTANGCNALVNTTTGSRNTADGFGALNMNTTGSGNIALGCLSGTSLTTGNDNIDIGNVGVNGDSNTIRIGTSEYPGPAPGIQKKTFIAGINGAGVTGTAVQVNAAGQLGTAPSAARFKQNIQTMDKASDVILALRPVTFRYKPEIDPEGIEQFGLVAEEVQNVSSALVARDPEGKPYTVRYDAVSAMLLNEFLKEHRKVEELQAKVSGQETTITRQQKRLDDLASGLAKVSAQVAATRSAGRLVNNSR